MRVPEAFKNEIKRVFRDWLSYLPVEKAQAPIVSVIGKNLTPEEIFENIDKETLTGTEFLSSLYRLHMRLTKKRPFASVATFFQMPVATSSAQAHR